MNAGRTYHFGPFRLDARLRKLYRDGKKLTLPDRALDVLLLFVAHPATELDVDEILDAVWAQVPITRNNVVKVVNQLRDALGRQEDGSEYIETLIRKGYVFIANVVDETPGLKEDGLDPFHAFEDGLTAIQTLNLDRIDGALEAFGEARRLRPDYADAHIGLATAHYLRYEATRADLDPDHASLALAAQFGDEGCRLAKASAHAWSTAAIISLARGDGTKSECPSRR